MTKVINIAGGTDLQQSEPSEPAILCLSALLELARAGKIQGVGVVFQTDTKDVAIEFGGRFCGFGMGGGAEALKHDLLQEMMAPLERVEP